MIELDPETVDAILEKITDMMDVADDTIYHFGPNYYEQGYRAGLAHLKKWIIEKNKRKDLG